MVLGLFAMKMCAFSFSTFRSPVSSYAMEKSNEEGKDTEEESFSKLKKKLLIYDPFLPENQSMPMENVQLDKISRFRLYPCNFPSRNVPTPPPDHDWNNPVLLRSQALWF